MLWKVVLYAGCGLLCLGGAVVALGVAALAVGFSRALAVKAVYGHWPHQSPEAMWTWGELP